MAVITTSAVVSAIVSSIVAFLMAIGSPMAVEKLGGIIGGVLSSMPSLIVPSSIAMVLSGASKTSVYDGMMFYPSGMLINAIIWVMWKIVLLKLPKYYEHHRKLLILVAMTFVSWISMALFAFFVIRDKLKVPSTYVGICCVIIHITIGFITVTFFHSDAPKGKNNVKLLTHIYRGTTSAIVIFIAVLISKMINPTIGGLIVSFPTIALSTLVSLFLAQGETVTNGAIGPIILASVSSCVYTMIFAVCLTKLSVFPSGIIAFLTSVLAVSAPTALYIRWISNRQAISKENNYLPLDEISSEISEEVEKKIVVEIHRKNDVELG